MFLVGGLGICMLLFVGNSFRWLSHVSVTHLRVREKLLRSPGESMRRNLEQLNEYLIYSVALFLFVPMVFAWKAPSFTSAWPLIFLIVLMVTCALPGICVVHLSRNYALSLRGARAVGEELNQLLPQRTCWLESSWHPGDVTSLLVRRQRRGTLEPWTRLPRFR